MTKMIAAVAVVVHFFLTIQWLTPILGECDIDWSHVQRVPAVTIMIINRNRAHLIGRALLSALAQSLPDIEILVADDASSDSSLDVISSFAKHDSRIRFFSNREQLTINCNRVKAVRESKGIFLLWLDSDDKLCNRTAEIDFRTAVARQVDMVEHLAFVSYRNGAQMPFTWKAAPFETANNN
jgi:succinoglycan biosynthesis protein ExoO